MKETKKINMKIKTYFLYAYLLLSSFHLYAETTPVTEEGMHIFLKYKKLYLTVHDDPRDRISTFVHARLRDKYVTKELADCSIWYLEPVDGIEGGYHIVSKSEEKAGPLYLTAYRSLDCDKRSTDLSKYSTSTYVHARRKDTNVRKELPDHSIWYIQPVDGYENGYHIILKATKHYLTVHHYSDSNRDVRDDKSVYVHVREKDAYVTTEAPNCSIWYIEPPIFNEKQGEYGKYGSKCNFLEEQIKSQEIRIKNLEEIIGIPN